MTNIEQILYKIDQLELLIVKIKKAKRVESAVSMLIGASVVHLIHLFFK